MPWQASDSTAAFAAGAAATGAAVQRQMTADQMAWARQERLMELRAQEAQRMINERHIAAQTDYLLQQTEHMKQTIEQEKEDEATMRALPQLYNKELMNTFDGEGVDHETAIRNTLETAAMVNPRVANKLAGTIKSMAEAQAAGKPKPLDPSQISANNARAAASTAQAGLATAKTAALGKEKSTPDTVGDEYKRYQAALDTGDNDLAEFHKARLLKLTQSTGTMIKTNPDGTVEITQGGPLGGDALTKTNQTKVQEAQAQSLATIDVANRLEPLIGSDTVGAKAFAESWIKDRVLAQAFPELASGKRAKAEQLAAQLRASAVKELRSDGNITEGERKQILQAIPSINDPADSPARAAELVKGVRKMAAIRALVASKRLGTDVPKSAAAALDDETLVDLWRQGLITQAQAAQAYKLKRATE